jgi:hypothetical protein
VWKLPVLKETTGGKTGVKNRSTDKEVLYELAFRTRAASCSATTARRSTSTRSSRRRRWISGEYNGDGRTRPQAIMFGTYTGRMTYASKQGKNKDARQIGFALHQIKRGSEYRGICRRRPATRSSSSTRPDRNIAGWRR